MEIGQVCLKIAGRDSNQKCVIIKILDETFVLIDGQTRRKRCNILHLEPLKDKLDIKEDAAHGEIVAAFRKLGVEVTERRPREKKEKPKKVRKEKVRAEAKEKPKSVKSKAKAEKKAEKAKVEEKPKAKAVEVPKPERDEEKAEKPAKYADAGKKPKKAKKPGREDS